MVDGPWVGRAAPDGVVTGVHVQLSYLPDSPDLRASVSSRWQRLVDLLGGDVSAPSRLAGEPTPRQAGAVTAGEYHHANANADRTIGSAHSE